MDRIRRFLFDDNDEPFEFVPRWQRYLYALSSTTIFLYTAWVISRTFRLRGEMGCKTASIVWFIVFYLLLAGIVLYLERTADGKLRHVFRSELDFSFERNISESEDLEEIVVGDLSLGYAAKTLPDIVNRAQNEEIPLLTATSNLHTEKGKKFFQDIRRTLRNNIRITGQASQLVRLHYYRKYLFILILNFCFFASVKQAFQASLESDGKGKCMIAPILGEFCKNIAISFLLVLVIISFAETPSLLEIFTVPLREKPLTDDEKFIISLLAVNTEEKFYGISASNIYYTDVDEEGTEDVLLPMHMSLFAFKPVRTADHGEMRIYDRAYDDRIGNFYVE